MIDQVRQRELCRGHTPIRRRVASSHRWRPTAREAGDGARHRAGSRLDWRVRRAPSWVKRTAMRCVRAGSRMVQWRGPRRDTTIGRSETVGARQFCERGHSVTMSATPQPCPRQPTPLIGRSALVDDVRARLLDARVGLLTLTTRAAAENATGRRGWRWRCAMPISTACGSST
jgi:hypothetical protein